MNSVLLCKRKGEEDYNSDYKWVTINDLGSFEPRVENIPEIVKTFLGFKTIIRDKDLGII